MKLEKKTFILDMDSTDTDLTGDEPDRVRISDEYILRWVYKGWVYNLV